MSTRMSTRTTAVDLPPEELAVLRLLWDGHSQKEAAFELGISHAKTMYLIRHAKDTAGARSTIELLRRCVRAGVLTV